MARIQDLILDCSFYLYETPEHARQGTPKGGTAFTLAVPVEGEDDMLLTYLVTAGHVPRQGYRTARMNLQGGGFEVFDIPVEMWQYPDSGDDIAVAPAQASFWRPDLVFNPLPLGLALWRQRSVEEGYGLGDHVFMVGRLLYHEGDALNTPVVRFGNIAMMPGEPVRNPHSGLGQESYLVEMRSISGFSGSPVFVYNDEPFGPTTRLLGVDWGHLPSAVGDESDRLLVNSGIACVVPAWALVDFLLGDPEVVEQRARVFEANQRSSPPPVAEGQR